jgi:O-methyltransferase
VNRPAGKLRAARRRLGALSRVPRQLDRLDDEIAALGRTAKGLREAVKDLQDTVNRLNGRPEPAAKPPAAKGPTGFDKDADEIIALARPYTMTSPDKLYSLISAVRHLARCKIEGAVVECGVWRGGSMHAVARALAAEGDTERDLYLFDTFTGMTEPTEKDKTHGGRSAESLLASAERTARVWAVASVDDVREGLATLPYPAERFHLVEGPVEKTIPGQAPERIALLRLDTDWYESTRHELEHLYDRLVPDGALIIDDYESWQGSKQATNEFLAGLADPPLMHRAGRSRIGIRPRPAPDRRP